MQKVMYFLIYKIGYFRICICGGQCDATMWTQGHFGDLKKNPRANPRIFSCYFKKKLDKSTSFESLTLNNSPTQWVAKLAKIQNLKQP